MLETEVVSSDSVRLNWRALSHYSQIEMIDADLPPGKANPLRSELMDRHRHQGNADLLASRKQHIHFASRWPVRDLRSEPHQRIGVLPHRADHHDNLVAIILRANCFTGGCLNLVCGGDACATKFLNK